jgi:hypothetical protein
MVRTFKLGVECANPDCDAGFMFGYATVDPENFGDVSTWATDFKPKQITCRKCGHTAIYDRTQLVEVPPDSEEYL